MRNRKRRSRYDPLVYNGRRRGKVRNGISRYGELYRLVNGKKQAWAGNYRSNEEDLKINEDRRAFVR